MKKYLLIYLAGVATPPTALILFRKPIIKYWLVPIFADEKMDTPLYNMMLARNDYKDVMSKVEDD